MAHPQCVRERIGEKASLMKRFLHLLNRFGFGNALKRDAKRVSFLIAAADHG
jgi:hypothetical protein